MRIPKRRGEELKKLEEPDHFLTPGRIEQMERSLEDLKSRKRPEAVKEVQRLAEMGDFSENVGYQVAKATLRRINNRILTLEEQIKRAIPIQAGPDPEGRVRIGSRVKLQAGGREVVYHIVGAEETDPTRGRISHASPLGRALVGRRSGEEICIETRKQKTTYRILDVA